MHTSTQRSGKSIHASRVNTKTIRWCMSTRLRRRKHCTLQWASTSRAQELVCRRADRSHEQPTMSGHEARTLRVTASLSHSCSWAHPSSVTEDPIACRPALSHPSRSHWARGADPPAGCPAGRWEPPAQTVAQFLPDFAPKPRGGWRFSSTFDLQAIDWRLAEWCRALRPRCDPPGWGRSSWPWHWEPGLSRSVPATQQQQLRSVAARLLLVICVSWRRNRKGKCSPPGCLASLLTSASRRTWYSTTARGSSETPWYPSRNWRPPCRRWSGQSCRQGQIWKSSCCSSSCLQFGSRPWTRPRAYSGGGFRIPTGRGRWWSTWKGERNWICGPFYSAFSGGCLPLQSANFERRSRSCHYCL